MILYVSANEDYTERPEPSEIVAFLREVGGHPEA
jgi:hypothetical protein